MKRLLILAAILFCVALPAHGQCSITVVTATVTDPNGLAYSGGTVMANLFPPGVAGPLCAGNVSPNTHVGPITLDSTGTFTMQLAANSGITPGGTQWTFNVSLSSTSIVPPVGNGGVSFSVNAIVTGATQNLSATISAAAPALTNLGTGGGGGGGFANRALSNLTSPTSVNQDLIPGSVGGNNVGNSAHYWNTLSGVELDLFGTAGEGIAALEGPLDTSNCVANADAFGFDAVTHTIQECDNGGAFNPLTKSLSGSGAPVGTGTLWQLYVNTTAGTLYFWTGSAWQQLGAAGSGVTSFTGDGTVLSNSGSVGAVTATLANAAAHSVFGNTSGSSGAPSYTANPSVSSVVLNGATSGSATLSATATGGTVNLGSTNATVTSTGTLSAPSHQASGTTFTSSGCSATSLTGGATAGQFASGTSGTCTITITMGSGQTAAHGWSCSASDQTTVADTLKQISGGSTTTAVLSGTTVSGDVVSFGCIGY